MSKILLALLLLFSGVVAYAPIANAEGGCPPGQVPQEGPGWKSCIPLGGDASSQGTAPPSRSWEARWVALTADAPNGVLGQSAESRTENEAVTSAMRDCASQGGTQCKVVISAKNGCVAMATSTKVYGTGSGPTEAAADTQATEECKKGGDPDCNVIFNRCVKAKIL